MARPVLWDGSEYHLAMEPRAVRIFVAMPGSTMGDRARWSDIAEIKRRLLEPAAERLREKLGRATELVIEKDKLESGPIHPSMFREAVDSDIYLADLSGANANVYLELGVRWALRDGITILISQDLHDVKFNVSGNRVIPYGPMPDELDRAISEIVAAALKGMQDPLRIDSPVRNSLSLVSAPKSEWDGLRQEIRRLQELQADDLVAAAQKSPPAQAVDLLRRAVDRNPVSVQARYQLGIALRNAADYTGAIRELEAAVGLSADWAPGWRELGVTLSKSDQLTDAVAAFQHAVELDASDAETWATLGGLRRRLARSSTGSAFDWATLREARDAYRRASHLRSNDTYALVNEARLELLLSAVEPETRPAALAQLHKLENLARYEAEARDRRDPWKLFDLVDTLLLTGRLDEGLAELRNGIDLIDPPSRESYLTSVISPLRDFLAVEVLDPAATAGVREAIEVCEQAIKESKSASV
jgi:tetratricopeptide (TPR) repeat protein